MSDQEEEQPRCFPLACADCGGHVWVIEIIHSKDGRTLLRYRCADDDCIENKRMIVGAGKDDVLFHDELDITGQGYDPEDMAAQKAAEPEGWN